MARVVNIAGRKFHRWSVVSATHTSSPNGAMWECLCTCGTRRPVLGRALVKNRSRSCGCLHSDTVRTHGKTRSVVYSVWRNIKHRCFLLSCPDYPNYGGRGVTMYKPWKDSFADFYSHVGDPPEGYRSIDRIDGTKGYFPGNVRWATPREQVNNRRNTKKYTHEGVTKPVSEWADLYGLETNMLAYRLLVKKMPFLEAVTTPVRKYTRKRIN